MPALTYNRIVNKASNIESIEIENEYLFDLLVTFQKSSKYRREHLKLLIIYNKNQDKDIITINIDEFIRYFEKVLTSHQKTYIKFEVNYKYY